MFEPDEFEGVPNDVPAEAFEHDVDDELRVDELGPVDAGAGEVVLDEQPEGGSDTYASDQALKDVEVVRAARPDYTDDGEDEPTAPVALPVFDTLDAWVNNWLIPVYVRDVSGQSHTWCPEWWRHPEAYVRLEALWRSWEHLRHEPGTGMAVWLRDYMDQHMTVLLSASGPFNGCKPTAHGSHGIKPLPTELMPTPAQIAAVYERVYGGVRLLQGRHGNLESPEGVA